jgi:hypothetical protein
MLYLTLGTITLVICLVFSVIAEARAQRQLGQFDAEWRFSFAIRSIAAALALLALVAGIAGRYPVPDQNPFTSQGNEIECRIKYKRDFLRKLP